MFQDGHSVITMGSVLPSLLAEPPAFMDAKREFLVRALKGSAHVDGVYFGYPSGAFFHMLRVEHNEAWRASVSAPEGTAFAMRVMTRAPDERAISSWRFLDAEGRQIAEGEARQSTFDPRRRPWYRAAIAADGPISVGPYVSASTGALTLSLAKSMANDKGTVMGADVMLETISHMLVENPVSKHSTGYVFDGEGRLLVHSDPTIMSEIVEGFDAGTESPLAANDPVLAAVRGLLASADGREQHDRLFRRHRALSRAHLLHRLCRYAQPPHRHRRSGRGFHRRQRRAAQEDAVDRRRAGRGRHPHRAA